MAVIAPPYATTSMIRICATALGLTGALLIAGRHDASGAELLVNGGFEQGAVGWAINSGDYGQLDIVNVPTYDGQSAARLTGSQLQAHSLSQWVQVQGGQSYRFIGWALLNDPAVDQIYLEVTWWEAGGSIVGSSFSPAPLTGIDAEYRFLDTGTIVSPEAARSARVAALVRTTGAFTVYVDDFTFEGPAPSPTPIVTPTPSPAPSATTIPEPTPARTPVLTSSPTPAPSGTPVPEPLVFPQLVNGGFERLRVDGTPYGWRKHGGEMSTTGDRWVDGSRSLTLKSSTTSTKWTYQTVAVTGGAYYEASAQALPGAGVDAVFIRISWYTSADGSGSSIDQGDSAAALSGVGFRSISSGAVQAPRDARSAMVRLMLRPTSEALATAYFDLVTFVQMSAPLAGTGGDADVRQLSARELSAAGVGANTGENAAAALGAVATPIRLANVKPPDRAKASNERAGGDGNYEWAIALAIAVPMLALTFSAGFEIWRRRNPADTAE